MEPMKYFSVLSLMNELEKKEYENHQETILKLEKEIFLAKIVIDQSREWIYAKNRELHDRHMKNLLANVK